MSKEFFAQSEFDSRHRKVREAMETAGIDVLLVIAPQNINYLIGTPAKGYQEFAMLFFPLEQGPLTVVSRLPEVPMLEAESLADDVRGWGEPETENWMTVVKQIIEDRKYAGLRLGLEVPAYYLHALDYQKLQSLLGPSPVKDATDLIGNIKLIKSPAEIAYIRKSADILDAAMKTCLGSLAAGKTEREVSADVHHTLLSSGSDIPSSPMNFLSGPRSAFAHGEPTDRVLETGDFMHIQFGAHVRRYCCTIGRQICLGEPTGRMHEIYQLARDAGDAAIGHMRAGVRATAPHEAAKKVISEAGMERYRLHMTGYAVGAAFPPSWIEPLIMDSNSTQTLMAGMVIAVEPPLFGLEEGLGVRIIDNVLVTESGCELLSKTTRDLIVV
ncbi:MAG: aminopeptidase P family protein [Hyphomicrobiales bacterium]|nr:aminopeptidase P family protein [Hyphomicrobiales bacterium]MCP5076417.1 aminopeptidase P family protein [Paracoccaceae bacterium]